MKYPVDIRKTIYASVASVRCGSDKGTGFFVAPDTLLTARHVVAEWENNQQPVIVMAGEKSIVCEVESIAEDGDNVDVVVLRCKDYSQEDHLKLLAAEFNEERQLTIVGYPREFGNCEELISIGVQDRMSVTKEDYDTTVVRTDALAFTSYKGFSGSPVLNEKGSVIGIVLSQYNNSLGYVSIKRLFSLLEAKNISVSKDWQSEDFSPCGRGASQRQVEKALSYASLRYNKNLHVENKPLNEEVKLFALREKRVEIEKELLRIELDAIKSFRTDLAKYRKGDYESLFGIMKEWRTNNPDNSKWTSDEKIFFEKAYTELQSNIDKWGRSKKQIVVFRGNAGMGKTHYVCDTAKRLCESMNVYLLFGSRFTGSKEFEVQLYEMMGISGKGLEALNDQMVIENSNALIIIDALNEGATDGFWQMAMRRMCCLLKKCDRLKLMVTFRNDENFDLYEEYDSINLIGFEENTKTAVRKYFEYYHIDDANGELFKKYRKEFCEPLFLSMFCVVAQRNMRFLSKDFAYSDLFHQYLKYRNEQVSSGVDEDPHRNVTEKALMKFAHYSLYYNGCNNISREKARHYADQICRNRTWSKSLLYWLLKENLMLSTGFEGENLMFGYQKMGDFLMADSFVRSKRPDNDKIDVILKIGSNIKYNSYHRFVIALLADWNLTPKLLERDNSTDLAQAILQSLKHQGKNTRVCLEWIKSHKIFTPEILHDHFDRLPLDVFMSAHQSLKVMEMYERDLQWTVEVNRIYNHRYHAAVLETFICISLSDESDEEWRKVTILLGWLCTTPHPYMRGRVMRRLVELFEKRPDMTLFALNEFHDCNDPYVVQVITSAVYGHLLRRRNAKEAAEIAESVAQHFYQNRQAPTDTLIRQWTMQTLAYADELNSDNKYMKFVSPPFVSPNPFDSIIDEDNQIDKTYFGESNGSKRMYETLFSGMSDFSRYVIGTNNDTESHVFLKEENGHGKCLLLEDLKLMVGNMAKHEFKWADDLGKLDNQIYSEGRYHNQTERFGKKYLWLALYKAYALLSDHWRMVDHSRFVFSPTLDDAADVPCPWYSDLYSRIDPSIIAPSDVMPYTAFETGKMENVKTVSNAQWLAEDYPIQEPRLELTDTDGTQWIVLTCYDGHKTPDKDGCIKDLFLFSNAAFVNSKDLEKYRQWAKEIDFYGRWMPERRNGSIDYLWSEYPWADTYKRTLRDAKDWQEPNDAMFKINLSYEAQLQEEWIGLNEDEINLREVCMPNHLVMEALNLYAAERGAVRDKANGTIVARNFESGKMNGLAIRKDYLDRYLSDNRQALVFYSLGEKYVTKKDTYYSMGNRYDLSGAYYYDNGSISEIQPMHISNTL